MPERMRILVVEDDHDLLELTQAILGRDGDVQIADQVGPALRLVAQYEFDLLVTDLNLSSPADGLVLAGAMRALHPASHTVLITGNPDFTLALEAMQSTLNVILAKPVDIDTLRRLPSLAAATPSANAGLRSPGKATTSSVLVAHRIDIVAAWLHAVETDPMLGPCPLAATDRLDHISDLVDTLADERRDADREREAAETHGRLRFKQNYRAEWIAVEVSHLRRVTMGVLLQNLLELDLSQLPTGIFELNAKLDNDLLNSLTAFGLLRG
jgi:ActR/RegA family two-component response regulator